MIHAYQEIYLNKLQAALGDAFDYAINACEIPGTDFIKLFTASSISKRIENGEPAYIAGKSGIDITFDIVFEATGKKLDEEQITKYSRSKEYWIGWVICYYQWFSTRRFSEIFRVLTFEDLEKMYLTLHEADVTKFVVIADTRLHEFYADTNLKRIRSSYGCSQSELSRLSGVSLRSIQMYEQRNKDINKASAETIYRFAKVLGCSMEDLIEK